MADTVSFYFFSRGVERSVHRPVKNREERITLEKRLERNAAVERFEPFQQTKSHIPRGLKKGIRKFSQKCLYLLTPAR
jgi:hypothetical protein